jgi:hypothetical protein
VEEVLPSVQPNGKLPLSELAITILKENSTAHYDNIRALWHIGDEVLKAREIVPSGSWRKELSECAAMAGVHPGSLDDAARAAKAFPTEDRECVLSSFASAGTPLTRSHVVVLSRMTRARRTRAIETMLRAPCSVADLRSL